MTITGANGKCCITYLILNREQNFAPTLSNLGAFRVNWGAFCTFAPINFETCIIYFTNTLSFLWILVKWLTHQIQCSYQNLLYTFDVMRFSMLFYGTYAHDSIPLFQASENWFIILGLDLIIFHRKQGCWDGIMINFDRPQSRWRHQMEIFSILLAICAGNSPVTG